MKNKKNAVGLAALLAALGGCAVIDKHERVPGWPELKIVEHYVPAAEMRTRCTPYAPPLSLPFGCTLFYLNEGEAHIYVSKEYPAPWVLEHERLHAAGYDHVGSTSMLRMLETWRKEQERRVLAKVLASPKE